MAKIKHIIPKEILNCQGIPTVEATVVLNDGTTATASFPTGESTGSFEAAEIRDHDKTRFNGMGVLKALSNINDVIAPKIVGMEANKQQEIDKAMIELDGTTNKGRLGSNATLPVSMAVSKAAAKSSLLPLFIYLRQFIKSDNTPLKIPTPMFNLINGGVHGGGDLDFAQFLVIPASTKGYDESLQMGFTIYQALKDVLKTRNLSTLTADEGGFSPALATNLDAFYVIKQAIDAASLRADFDVFFGLDAASNNFFSQEKYKIKDKNTPLSTEDLISYYKEVNKQFKLLYLEDPLFEQDFQGWSNIYSQMAGDTIIAGDDLTATNPYRLQMALAQKAISGVVIKPNQIGTVIEALAVSEIARQAGLKTIVSARSGETNDDFIADFAVSVSSDYVKFGAPARGERVAKYNRLLHIEKQLKSL